MSKFYLIATWEMWNFIDMLRSERLLESLSLIHESLQRVISRKARSKIRGVSKKFMGVRDRELRSEGVQ
jgi:hypothetical protein